MAEQTETSKDEKAAAPRTPRTFASRAERSLKETDRLLKKTPNLPEHDRAMVQLEQAKVLAMLELADAFRGNGKVG